MTEVETVVWCPRCQEDKYEIRRVPTGNQGVHENVTVPANRGEKKCQCGTQLERKA